MSYHFGTGSWRNSFDKDVEYFRKILFASLMIPPAWEMKERNEQKGIRLARGEAK
jgi:hypothetical protein